MRGNVRFYDEHFKLFNERAFFKNLGSWIFDKTFISWKHFKKFEIYIQEYITSLLKIMTNMKKYRYNVNIYGTHTADWCKE